MIEEKERKKREDEEAKERRKVEREEKRHIREAEKLRKSEERQREAQEREEKKKLKQQKKPGPVKTRKSSSVRALVRVRVACRAKKSQATSVLCVLAHTKMISMRMVSW